MVVDGVRVASQAAHEAGVEEEEDPLALLYHVVLNAPAIKELRFYSRWAGRKRQREHLVRPRRREEDPILLPCYMRGPSLMSFRRGHAVVQADDAVGVPCDAAGRARVHRGPALPVVPRGGGRVSQSIEPATAVAPICRQSAVPRAIGHDRGAGWSCCLTGQRSEVEAGGRGLGHLRARQGRRGLPTQGARHALPPGRQPQVRARGRCCWRSSRGC